MNKESGSPDSRAGARLLQQPYFLSAEGASCPEGFFVIGTPSYYKKSSAPG